MFLGWRGKNLNLVVLGTLAESFCFLLIEDLLAFFFIYLWSVMFRLEREGL